MYASHLVFFCSYPFLFKKVHSLAFMQLVGVGATTVAIVLQFVTLFRVSQHNTVQEVHCSCPDSATAITDSRYEEFVERMLSAAANVSLPEFCESHALAYTGNATLVFVFSSGFSLALAICICFSYSGFRRGRQSSQQYDDSRPRPQRFHSLPERRRGSLSRAPALSEGYWNEVGDMHT